jgi:phage-related tail fiber protein
MNSVITKIRREKMAEASRSGSIARITQIAVGSGGVDEQGSTKLHSEDDTELFNELLRREYSSCTKTGDASYEYSIKLEEIELLGEYISEMALIDEDGDVAAFLTCLPKGKDSAETTFAIEDCY